MTEDTKRGPGRPPKAAESVTTAETVMCRVQRDYWPQEGVRIRAGEIIECTPMEAIEGIERGALERVR